MSHPTGPDEVIDDHAVEQHPDAAPLSAREVFTLVMFAVMIVGTAGCMIWLFFIR
ncbi:MAG TPA: hypothetical protein IAA98_12945 [Candidatus Avipropionibacterium avicola]|uniref:Uncharacterized protein n=1 Tax=Candidatus Avipropionibacterium avicola TaxID=2840701 RepID=A0A9D1KNA1_9ACTN|nr:hypothetical protein [Candidatus Avipropionibacterium avicola]